MTITEPMLLPPDVSLVPVDQLTDEVRDQFEHHPGDHALTRPRSRTPSTIVDVNTARLLGSFREPTRIVDAVIAFATAEQVDPRQALERSYPVLRDLIRNGLLVPADSDLAKPIGASLEPGAAVGRFEVLRAVHVMIDTELYLGRDPAGDGGDASFAAIKIARLGSEDRMRAMLAREADFLASSGTGIGPRLLELGELDSRPYLALEWRPGADADTTAAELRRLAPDVGRPALLDLCASILAAYARLHGRGILHGDVHPSNVVVAADGSVTLVDFGLATREGDSSAPRGGIDFFMDPETAAASGGDHPWSEALTARGEQYSVAALLYFLVTGSHTHDFSLEPVTMSRQLSSEPPLSFERRGVTGLREIEAVLSRALAKDPAARFPDLTAFVGAWRVATAADAAEPSATRTTSEWALPPGTPASRLLDDTLARLDVGGEVFASELVPPRASFNLGAAGLAYGLLRIACARDDDRTLALADLWSVRSLAGLGNEDAFVNRELEITPDQFGTAGVHHSATGVFATAAAIAAARGDEIAWSVALAGFVGAGGDPADQRDVSFGTAGILLAAAGALEAGPPHDNDRASIRELGGRLAAEAWSELASPGAIGGSDQRAGVTHLGGAHGWGGMLYGQLRWAEATGSAPPDGIVDRLRELGALGTPVRRGFAWPRLVNVPDDGALTSSWCNGAAGLVALWTLAAAFFPGAGFERLAEGSAWTAYDGPPAPGDFCCGLAGRAYGLLNLYRAGGDRLWLARARDLADRAALAVRADALRRDSLYKGEIGVAVLAADLERPAESAMPMYDREPWPRIVSTDLGSAGREPATAGRTTGS